eukprot:SAG11_NODE_724_length_7524_cov_6.241481_7_plen_114_part_00
MQALRGRIGGGGLKRPAETNTLCGRTMARKATTIGANGKNIISGIALSALLAWRPTAAKRTAVSHTAVRARPAPYGFARSKDPGKPIRSHRFLASERSLAKNHTGKAHTLAPP